MNCALRECDVRVRMGAHTCVHETAQAHSHERARHTRAYMQHTRMNCALRECDAAATLPQSLLTVAVLSDASRGGLSPSAIQAAAFRHKVVVGAS